MQDVLGGGVRAADAQGRRYAFTEAQWARMEADSALRAAFRRLNAVSLANLTDDEVRDLTATLTAAAEKMEKKPMTDAIRAAFDRERRAKEEHHAASLALSEAVAAYRAEHPAPGRQILALGALPRRGARHDGALPDECTREDYGFECGAVAVSWGTDGQALCRRHLEER